MLKLYFQPHTSEFMQDNSEFQIAEINHVYNNPNWLFNFHSHDALAEIIVIADGRGTYSIDGTAFSATKGDLFLINAHSLHALMSDPNEPLNSWTLTMSGLQLPNLPPNYILPPSSYPYFPNCAESPLIIHLLERMASEYLTESSAAQDLPSNDLLRQLGLSIVLLARQAFESSSAAAHLPEKQTQRRELALEIMNYIDKHYREPISNNALADHFHISVGHLGHLFTEEFGISPINYQISRRMSDAQWMLIRTDKSINKIAHEIGYENPYHFTKLFIKRLGVHPKDYREQFQTSRFDPPKK